LEYIPSIRLRYFGSKAFVVKALSLVFEKRAFGEKTRIERCAAARYTASVFLETMERIQRLFVSIGVDDQKPTKTIKFSVVVGGTRGVSAG